MIDLHKIVTEAVKPVRTKPAEAYAEKCTVITSDAEFEVADVESVIVEKGLGTGAFLNPAQRPMTLHHLGNALVSGARKINTLPSACDLIAMSNTSSHFILVELTESNERSLAGGKGKYNIGKRRKAHMQLCNSIIITERAGFNFRPDKKVAIFFFRLPESRAGDVAARSLRAFLMNPALSSVTIASDPSHPDWEFRSHPYPIPYTI